jgi:MFS family permease
MNNQSRRRDFAYITVADFIVRAAYQMGKTPLLPIFAASLGASNALLGFIVSVSTLTGMVLKPFIGILSDRWGRRWWLIAGTAFFGGMPFLYRFVESPEQLVILRVTHGLATAIYGPVTLAYVVEMNRLRRGERLGWFEMARSGGYIVGPALAGWLLLTLDPVQVFTVIGLMSLLAFVPVLRLTDYTPRPESPPSLRIQVRESLRAGSRTPAIWLSGGLEAAVYIATYALKAFLPLYALNAGVSIVVVGLFFSVQEAVSLVLRPLAGRTGDRIGYLNAIAAGMVVIGVPLLLLPQAHGNIGLLTLAALMGCGQALVFPAATALISDQIDDHYLGAGLGLAGTLDNLGKVIGPILGGLLAGWLGYVLMFRGMGGMLLVFGAAVWFGGFYTRTRRSAVPST